MLFRAFDSQASFFDRLTLNKFVYYLKGKHLTILFPIQEFFKYVNTSFRN